MIFDIIPGCTFMYILHACDEMDYKLLSLRPDALLEPVIDYECIFVFYEKKKKK